MQVASLIGLIVKYWPSVVAALGVAYAVAGGQSAAITPAIAALLATLGLNAGVASAHAKLASVTRQNSGGRC